MTDTPYTLTTMALVDELAGWHYAARAGGTNLAKTAESQAREALLAHLRAAQAVPEDERAAFEAWEMQQGISIERFDPAKNPDDEEEPEYANRDYYAYYSQDCWIVWQARAGAKT